MTTKSTAYLFLYFIIAMLIMSPIACGNAKENPKETSKPSSKETLKDKLIGKWKWQSGSDSIDTGILEFYDNNTFKGIGRWMLSGNGNWDLLKDGRIQFRDTIGNMVIGKLTDGKLRIERSAKEYDIFHKIKE